MRSFVPTAAAAAVLAIALPATAAQNPAWTEPMKPFHIIGPIYDVGSAGLVVLMIKTSAGVIVIDTANDNALSMIDLSSLDPDDGFPDCESIAAVGGTLYVSCGVLDPTMQTYFLIIHKSKKRKENVTNEIEKCFGKAKTICCWWLWRWRWRQLFVRISRVFSYEKEDIKNHSKTYMHC